MIAKIFKAHGFHLGSDRFVNHYGYRTYENLDIRRAINRISTVHGHLDKRLDSGYTSKDVRKIFETHMRRSPWCIKVGPQYFELMNNAFPDIHCVMVLRDIENIIKSQQDKRGGNNIKDYVTAYVDGIEALHRERGFPIIQSDEVIDGNYAALEKAMSYCGVQFDAEIAEACIERGKWHYASNMR